MKLVKTGIDHVYFMQYNLKCGEEWTVLVNKRHLEHGDFLVR